jgi:protein O-GlcNAc transferase
MASSFARAQELHASGRLEEALALYEQALAEAPGDWRALTRLGLLHVQQGRHDSAEPLLQRAVALNGANPEAHAWLGESRRHRGRLEEAAASLRDALRLQPDFAPAWFNLGLALAETKDPQGAIDAWSRFVELRPADARVRRELASVCLQAGDAHEAARWLRQHVDRFPSDAAAWLDLGVALERQAHLASAIDAYERAAELVPGRAEIHNALAVAHHNFARHDAALQHYRAALAIRPDFAEVHSNLLMALHYVQVDADAMLQEHLAWSERHVAGIAPAPRASFPNDRDPDRRLRIGYVSPRLCAGPVSQNFLPLVQAHDHAAFHVTCYSTGAVQDAVTERIRSHCDGWREAAQLDDDALARQVRADAIDILFDLSGHCPGHRLRMFAARAAPVQATWLDYSNTTGLRGMDHFVGDALQAPEGTLQRFTEEVVRLPGPRLCYAPPVALPPVVPPPALSRGYVTFGCVNRLSKLNPDLVATWSAILGAVSGSRLLLKGTAYGSPEVRSAVAERFARHGIDASRLELRGFSDEARMMAEYGDIDICLDPFPYNGSTTTCDALAMGVPVVSLEGDSIVSRAGLMFLTACGMPDWVARDRAGYVRMAQEAAGDLHRLEVLRAGLRERFLASSACDGAGFARAFEQACRAMWGRFVLEAG